MKLRRVALTNVGCFLERQELALDGEMAILVGPNGGGKTTLIDTAIRALRKYLLIARFGEIAGGNADAPVFGSWETSREVENSGFNKHFLGELLPQKIELDIEITEPDLLNIKTIKRDIPEIERRSPIGPQVIPIGSPKTWNFDEVKPGTLFHYEIVNGQMLGMTAEASQFAAYLQSFDAHRQLRQAYDLTPLSVPIVYFPVFRQQGLNTSVQLSQSSISSVRRQSEGSNSKSTNAGLFELAMQILAERALQLHHLYRDPTLDIKKERGPALLTEVLLAFGYSWEFKCTNRRNNTWGIDFQKNGCLFNVGMASAGEAEILYYAVSITLLDIRDTLVAIDEPEIHLHPRAQRLLLNLFQKLSFATNNQFVFATHSPLFITPESIRHVARVASSKGVSSIIQIDQKGIPDGKKAFDLINALNNEKIFFAEKVILVEGSSDEIFFTALLRNSQLLDTKDIEIVRVGGKHNFVAYQTLLNACSIPHAVIADLDYLREIGSLEIKQLFGLREARIKKCIDEVGISTDGTALVEAIQKSIETRDVGHLDSVWTYVTGRHTELRAPLSQSERMLVNAFIAQQRENSIFILQLGGLEAYLPDGYKSKDINKLIELLESVDFLKRFSPSRLDELVEIGRSAVA